MNDILVMPVMGAVVGYCTNWLAIKMVFRPYEEKRVLGMRVPFTPGVMAKERYVFSKKLGDSLSENIITTEEIIKYTQNLNFDEIVKNLIKNNKIDKQLSEFVTDEKSVQAIKNIVLKFLKDGLSAENKEKLSIGVATEVNNFLFDFLNDGDQLDGLISKQEQVEILKSFKHNDEVFKVLNNLITKMFRNQELLNKEISEILGNDTTEKIIKAIDEKSDDIRLGLLDFVNSDDFGFVEEKIRGIVAQGVGAIPLASMFGGSALAEMIVPILKEKMVDTLEDPDNNEEIAETTKNIANILLKTKTETVLNFVSQDVAYGTSQKLIIDTVNSFTETVESGNSSIEYKKMFEPLITAVQSKVPSIIEKGLDSIVSDDSKLEVFAQGITENLLKIRVSDLTSNVDDELMSKIAQGAKNLFDSNIGRMVESINISEIVENKINSFDMREAEKLVIDVINKELKMITNLGGVLGFAIGLASAFL